MSLKDYKLPFSFERHDSCSIYDANHLLLCCDLSDSEAAELCSILNSHLKIQRCEKCRLDIYATYPAPTKFCSCGTELIWVDPPNDARVSFGFTTPAPDPQPDIDATNKVAEEWYKSGRKLKVEYWHDTLRQWRHVTDPGFSDTVAWRIAPPEKEHQVWNVYRDSSGFEYRAKRGTEEQLRLAGLSQLKHVGTLQGEVEV